MVHEVNGSTNNVDEEEEIRHFQRIVNSFKNYKNFSFQRIAKTEAYLHTLPSHHQQLLNRYKNHLNDLKVCIQHNNEIIKLITHDVNNLYENISYSLEGVGKAPTLSDMEKVHQTLKQIVRDWTHEGEEERTFCYIPILKEIEEYFPPSERNPKDISVLVPGAGLGRLAFEIARRGYTCQGNEFSLFMLFVSNFVLNRTQGIDTYKLYPWVSHFMNNLRAEDQLASVQFPDVNTSDLPPGAQFSMAAGDFLQVYQDACSWDCVATCFFLDCANNVLEFLETIWRILKPGGIWINLGPLLYHFADMPNENSIEPSYDMLREIILNLGFVVEKENTNMSTLYSQNPRSMLHYVYHSAFFVCRKPLINETAK